MKRANLWIAAFTLIWFGCLPAPAENEGAEESAAPDIVRLEIGATSYRDLGKSTQPMPEVPVGEPFWLEVHWLNPPAEGLQLALWDFRTASYSGEPMAERAGEASSAWSWNEGDVLTPSDDSGLLPDNRVVLDSAEAEKGPEGAWVTRKRIRLDRDAEGRPDPDSPSLIFFETSVMVGDEEQFSYDPPWVEKDPTG